MKEQFTIKPDPSDKTAYNKWHYRQNKPYPVKLGEYKIPLMQFSNDLGHSLHHVLLTAVKEFCTKHNIDIESKK